MAKGLFPGGEMWLIRSATSYNSLLRCKRAPDVSRKGARTSESRGWFEHILCATGGILWAGTAADEWDKHGHCQPPGHCFMGGLQGMLKIEVRSPGTAQVCYESGLEPLK